MKKIELTIIVPTYNVESYIRRSLDSILMQEYIDYELIIVDDASTDSTRKIIEEYKEKDSRIKTFFFDINKGPAQARQYALDRSQGAYIMFVDADDRYLTDQAVGLMIDAITRSDADCVGCRYQLYYNNNLTAIRGPKRFTHIMTNKEVALQKLKKPKYHWHYLVNHCYKSKIIKENNIKFDTSLLLKEDMKFNYDYMYYAKKYVFIKDCLYEYNCINENSITKKRYKSSLKRQMNLFIKAKNEKQHLTEIYKKMGLYNKCKKEINQLFYQEVIRLNQSAISEGERDKLADVINNDLDYIESVSILGNYIYCVKLKLYKDKLIRQLKNRIIKIVTRYFAI